MSSLSPAFFAMSFTLDKDFHKDHADVIDGMDLDEEDAVLYGFAVEVPSGNVSSLEEDIADLADWLEDILCDIEGEYGVHDWCSGPRPGILCLGYYHTYEVAPDKIGEVMEQWHARLSQAPVLSGARFGKIVRFTDPDVDDAAAHKALIAAGSL